MKKILLPLITVFITITFVACNNSNQTVELPNPLTEITSEQLLNETGISFVIPEGAINDKYFTISGDKLISQAVFEINNVKVTCRAVPTDIPINNEIEDISGYYFNWEKSETTTVNNSDALIKLNPNKEGCICWYDYIVGILYNVSMSNEATEEKLITLAQTCCPPMQGNAGPTDEIIKAYIGKGNNVVEEILPLSLDVNNDGNNETVNAYIDNSIENPTYVFYISPSSGNEVKSATEIISKASIHLADIDEDGLTEIFLSGDSGNDDYITYCWKYDGNELISICFSEDMRSGNSGSEMIYGIGFISSIEDNNLITMDSFTNILGTNSSSIKCSLVNNIVSPLEN